MPASSGEKGARAKGESRSLEQRYFLGGVGNNEAARRYARRRDEPNTWRFIAAAAGPCLARPRILCNPCHLPKSHKRSGQLRNALHLCILNSRVPPRWEDLPWDRIGSFWRTSRRTRCCRSLRRWLRWLAPFCGVGAISSARSEARRRGSPRISEPPGAMGLQIEKTPCVAIAGANIRPAPRRVPARFRMLA